MATTGAGELLLTSLATFYRDADNLRCLLHVLCRGASAPKVSLRLVDWFLTSFSRRHGTIVYANATPPTPMRVHETYKAQMKAYGKKMFDPFRRGDRVAFVYQLPGDKPEVKRRVDTTLGQLNIFRWLISSGVLAFVSAHAAEIEADMLAASHQHDTTESRQLVTTAVEAAVATTAAVAAVAVANIRSSRSGFYDRLGHAQQMRKAVSAQGSVSSVHFD
jgi:hypothetical protein